MMPCRFISATTFVPRGDRPFHFQPVRSPVFESESWLVPVVGEGHVPPSAFIELFHHGLLAASWTDVPGDKGYAPMRDAIVAHVRTMLDEIRPRAR